MQGKIIKGIAGFYYVHVVESGVYECKAKGVFRKEKIKPLVGDNVEIEILDESEKKGNIVKILPRQNELIRPAVANIDQALLVFAITKPNPHFNLLDRFLVMMESKEIPVVLCFNKEDIATDPQVKELESIYESCGYPLVFVSAKKERGIETIRELLKGKTTAIAGPSGVGKSSIINILQPEADMETGAISTKIERGKHTTRHSELFAIDENSYQSEETKMHELFKAIYLGNEQEIVAATNREVDRIHGNSNTVSQYKLYTMEMVGAFYRFCENNFIDFNDFLGEMSNPYEKVPKMDESTLKKWIVQVSTEMGKQLKSVRNSKSRRLINDAKNIVANRYMEEDLSLDKVCSIMGVSNSYFSSIFKKETGISFVSYLTDYRMDIAAKLILDTNEKSYKIGEMVGYMDANYFSYVFKKKFGISPSKYRNAKLKS